MKKHYLLIVGLAFGLTACNSEESKKEEKKEVNDPEKDAKAFCECYQEAGDDGEAQIKCTELWSKHQQKYQQNQEQLDTYNNIARKCERGS